MSRMFTDDTTNELDELNPISLDDEDEDEDEDEVGEDGLVDTEETPPEDE